MKNLRFVAAFAAFLYFTSFVAYGTPLTKFRSHDLFFKDSIVRVPKKFKQVLAADTADEECKNRCSLGMGEPLCDCDGLNGQRRLREDTTTVTQVCHCKRS